MKHDFVASFCGGSVAADARASSKLGAENSLSCDRLMPLGRWLFATKLFVLMIARKDQRAFYATRFVVVTEGKAFERSLHAVRATPAGQDLLRRRPDWWDFFSDRSRLQACPPGSLGLWYIEHMTLSELDESYYLSVVRNLTEQIETDVERAWLRVRIDTAHDLRHVVAGYGTDVWGEACLLSFRFAQTRHIGLLILSLFGLLTARFSRRGRVLRSWLEAYRRGRDAKFLDLILWENAFDQPLSRIRAVMGLHPIRHYPSPVAPEAYIASERMAHCEWPPKAITLDPV